MTDSERDSLKRDYPAHWFVRVVTLGYSALVAIPKRDEITPVPSMPELTLDMLHGSVIRINDHL